MPQSERGMRSRQDPPRRWPSTATHQSWTSKNRRREERVVEQERRRRGSGCGHKSISKSEKPAPTDLSSEPRRMRPPLSSPPRTPRSPTGEQRHRGPGAPEDRSSSSTYLVDPAPPPVARGSPSRPCGRDRAAAWRLPVRGRSSWLRWEKWRTVGGGSEGERSERRAAAARSEEKGSGSRR